MNYNLFHNFRLTSHLWQCYFFAHTSAQLFARSKKKKHAPALIAKAAGGAAVGCLSMHFTELEAAVRLL
jgi:hypothetical protein